MRFRIIYNFKIAIALGVVLVLVVLLEYTLLNLYVKDTHSNFPNSEHTSINGVDRRNHPTNIRLISTSPAKESKRGEHTSIDGVVDRNDLANIRLISTSPPKESNIEKQHVKADEAKRTFTPSPVIHVSAVVCGERSMEAVTMLKSTTLFTNRTVQFHVVAEDDLHDELTNIFTEWPNVKSGQVLFKLYSLHSPSGENAEEWKRLFKPCASQRLFLLDVLDGIDSVLYLDADVLMLRPVEDLWNHFKNFDAVQLASMTPENEGKALSWYPRFAHHPFSGENGMNSGVMLMNLTRMRAFNWTEKILDTYHKYKLSLKYGDQDLLNIVFHYHPELLYTHSCDWNYRTDHCLYGNNCGQANKKGISVIHGNREVFRNTIQPFFKAIYITFRDFKPGDDKKLIAKHLEENLHTVSDTPCGSMIESVLKFPNMLV